MSKKINSCRYLVIILLKIKMEVCFSDDLAGKDANKNIK